MEKIKTRMLVGGLAMAIAGGASAVPMIPQNWTKTFTVTGTGNNIPGSVTPPVPTGTLWLYGIGSNQTTTVTLGSAGPDLTATNPNNGNPVEYTLEKIVIEGIATSLIQGTSGPTLGYGTDRLVDIQGTVEQLGPGGGVSNYLPFAGVGVGCGTSGTAQKIYNTANLGTGEWTGLCPGTHTITPLMISSVVTDATQFELFFWNVNNPTGASDEPEARVDGLTVKFMGTCTDNCETAANPAPATIALLLLGLTGLGATRRRKGG